jgi:putative membrane protein
MTLTHRLALTAMFAGAAAFAQTSTGTSSKPASGMHSTAPSSDTEAVKSATKMTPSGVLSIIHQVNQDEIKLGKMAQAQAQDDKVKGFAKDMVDDHTALDKKLTDFVQKEGKGKVTLSASQIPAAKHAEMKSSTEKAEAKLKSATGATFDKEYMSAMLKGHDNVLTDLDAALPSLKGNDKVHDLVSDARDKVKEHRDHARDILTDLEKGAATGGSGMQGSTGTTMPGQSRAPNPGTTTPQSVGGGAPGATTGTSGTAAPGTTTPDTTRPSTTGH